MTTKTLDQKIQEDRRRHHTFMLPDGTELPTKSYQEFVKNGPRGRSYRIILDYKTAHGYK